MAAALPISATVDRVTPRVTPATQPFGTTTPSSTLPLLFTITGLLALFFSAGWLVARPEILARYHYSPGAIALTHLFVLGWLGFIVMGAMYQLVPVALETKLFSERLAEQNEKVIFEALRQVIEPEIGCNILDLGLIYGVAFEAGKVWVTMTLTTPGCPMHESISWGVKNALLNLEGITEAEVDIVWNPPWHP